MCPNPSVISLIYSIQRLKSLLWLATDISVLYSLSRVNAFRLRFVSLDLTETAETVCSAGHTAFWRPISLVQDTAGVCLQLCASSFPALLRHLPLDLSVPFRAMQWSLSGGSWDACCFSRGCRMRIDPFLIIKAERTCVCLSLFLVHLIMCSFSFLTFSSPIFYFHLFPCLYLLFPQWDGSCRKTLTDQWKVMSLLSRWSAVEAVSCALVYCGSVQCWAMFSWISSTVSGFFSMASGCCI